MCARRPPEDDSPGSSDCPDCGGTGLLSVWWQVARVYCACAAGQALLAEDLAEDATDAEEAPHA